MDQSQLSDVFPYAYHMAEDGSWPSIQRNGLLSTSSLLDLFEISGTQRNQIESRHRSESIAISHPVHGGAVVRDQKPMSDAGLRRCLQDYSPDEWYRLLNSKVFFWLTRDRLLRLLNARAYRHKEHCVLTVETRRLIPRYASRITLSPMNSGCTLPSPHARGDSTFQSIDAYPYSYWRRKRSASESVVELAVAGGVPDISDYVVRVERMRGNVVLEVILDT